MGNRVRRFGIFTFDLEALELFSHDRPIRLQPQPARVLACLVERPGQLVTRDELRQHIWGEETFVDFERSRNFCIAQIRSALWDTASSPRFVETVPKRGYRFTAPVSAPGSVEAAAVVPAGGLPAGGQQAQSDHPAARHAPTTPALWRRRTFQLTVIVTALAAAAGTWVISRGQPAEAPRLAVVRFDNETSRPALDGLVNGLTDNTVAKLASLNAAGLGIIGSAPQLIGPRPARDLAAVAAELGADFLLIAQVQEEGGRLRVVAHLLRGRDLTHLWAERFEEPTEDTFLWQRLIADRIATAVVARLGETTGRR